MANKGFQNGLVSGFSKKSKQEKIEWIANNCFSNPTQAKEVLQNLLELRRTVAELTR